MSRLLLALVLVLPIALVGATSDQNARAGSLRAFTKTSTVAQADQDTVLADDFRITSAANPFTFRTVGKIRKITEIRITLTLEEGDTGPGEYDENNLSLALDGIDTGILLNGFRDVQKDTMTISGKPLQEPQLRAALKADKQLKATIIDAEPEDGNEITGSSADVTTLVLKGKQTR